MAKMKHQELLKGLIRLHILHHAAKEEFYGQWMIHELARHGYTLSPGTLYPMLHALERDGYLRSGGTAGSHVPTHLSRHCPRPGGGQGRQGPGPRAYRPG